MTTITSLQSTYITDGYSCVQKADSLKSKPLFEVKKEPPKNYVQVAIDKAIENGSLKLTPEEKFFFGLYTRDAQYTYKCRNDHNDIHV